MKIKKWTMLVAMIGVLSATAFANDKDDISKNREDQFKERRAFFKENIKPKVDEQRTKLDETISAEDKKEIEQIREEIINQLLVQNEFYFEARASRIKGEEVNESLMLELKAQRIVIENLYDKAKLIANKYRPEIDDMLADLRKELRSERDSSKNRYGKERGEYGRSYGHRPRGNGDGHGRTGAYGNATGIHRGFRPHSFWGPGLGINERLDIVGFLLWDVNRG